MLVVPVPQGTWSVQISAEGYQPTSSTTDPNVGKVDGLIAYDDSSEGWNIGIGKNVAISNNRADNTWKYGHPDLEVNSCHFNQKQCLERDGIISFHIETTGEDANFFLVSPPVQKLSKYNYAVSYGAWTDRDMEIGLITITLDQKLGSAHAREVRAGHSGAETFYTLVQPPVKENTETQPLQIEAAAAQAQKSSESEDSSDSEQEPVLGVPVGEDPFDVPGKSFQPGDRIVVDEPFRMPDTYARDRREHLLRDRDPLAYTVEKENRGPSPPIEEDPWKHVRSFQENKPSKPKLSVSGESQTTLRTGSLRPREAAPSNLRPKSVSPPRTTTSKSLFGGFGKKTDSRLAQLTSTQLYEYRMIKNSRGITAAEEYLRSLGLK
nr:MAG: ORF5 [Panicum distortion mosaic virus]